MEHPRNETILDYVAGRASDEQELEVDAHMAECAACLERVGALCCLRENFDEHWRSWTAAEHGRAHRQGQLAAALARVVSAQPMLAAGVGQWLAQSRRTDDVMVEVLVDASRRVALAGAGALPADYAFEPRPALMGVAAAEEQAQVEGHLRKGGELLSERRTEEALDEALRAAAIDARAPQTAVSEVRREDRRVLGVTVNSRRETVSVKYWPSSGEPTPALVLLLPRGADAEPLASGFEAVADAEYLLAELNNVPSGPHTLRIGPFLPSHGGGGET